MNKIDIGQLIAILANLGVISGIAFLAIEIRDGNTQARIAATQEVIAQRSAWRELIAGDASLSDIYARGLLDFESLDPVERQQFSLLMQSFLFKLSGNISARNVGLVGLNPDFEARSIEGDVSRMLDQPGFYQWWEQTDRRGFPENILTMIAEIDAIRGR
jgi:hypothetical protein